MVSTSRGRARLQPQDKICALLLPKSTIAERSAISKLVEMSAFPTMFTPFLDSLTLVEPMTLPQTTPLVIVAAEKSASTANGASFIKPPLHLYQLRDTDVKLVGFRKKLQQVLKTAGHVSSEPVVDAILACVVGASGPAGERRYCSNHTDFWALGLRMSHPVA